MQANTYTLIMYIIIHTFHYNQPHLSIKQAAKIVKSLLLSCFYQKKYSMILKLFRFMDVLIQFILIL